jgi:hypothetical protein
MKKVTGKVSWFGTKLDASIKPNATLALYPNVTRDMMQYPFLNPLYCAMRWDYKKITQALKISRKKAIDALRKAIITVEYKNRMVNLVPVDWGPHPKTARIIDISPLAMKSLNCKTDEEVTILLPDWIFLT